MRRVLQQAALAAAVLALLPASALAAHHSHHHKPLPPGVQQVLEDCANHNRLQGHYTVALLEQTLRDMPTYDRVYSTCGGEIQSAIQALLGGSRQPPKSSPAVRQQIAKNAPSELHRAAQAGEQPVSLGGAEIAAGAVQVNGSSLLSALPTPILIVLIALIVLGAVPVGIRLRSIVRARGSR